MVSAWQEWLEQSMGLLRRSALSPYSCCNLIDLSSCPPSLTLSSSARSNSASSACFSKSCLWTNRLCPPQSLSSTVFLNVQVTNSLLSFTVVFCAQLTLTWLPVGQQHTSSTLSGGWSTTCVLLFQGGFMCFPPGTLRTISFCGETSMCPLTFPTLLSNRGGLSESNRK